MINVLAIGRNSQSRTVDLCLTARALGASEITFIGREDKKLVKYINTLDSKWGGRFKVTYVKNPQELLKKSEKAIKVYLTRYGVPLNEKSSMIRTYKNMILIVSIKENLKKIEGVADFNVSITPQPHCSPAAIAVFLHEYYKGRELAMHFENARYKIVQKEA